MKEVFEDCSKCSNTTEGKIKRNFGREITRDSLEFVLDFIPIKKILALPLKSIFKKSIDGTVDIVESSVFEKTEYEFKCPKCGHTWTKVVENEEYKTLNKILVEYNPLKKETIDNAKETVEKVFSKMKTSFANPLKEKIKLFKKEQKNKIKPIHK